jgi:hypothetical protein
VLLAAWGAELCYASSDLLKTHPSKHPVGYDGVISVAAWPSTMNIWRLEPVPGINPWSQNLTLWRASTAALSAWITPSRLGSNQVRLRVRSQTEARQHADAPLRAVGLGGRVEADPGLVDQPGDPLGPQHRWELT